jgi:hypothetical protein
MHGTLTGIGSPIYNPQQQTAWGLSPQSGQSGSPYWSLSSPIQQQILQVLQVVPQQLQALQQIAYVQQQQLQQIQQAVQQLAQSSSAAAAAASVVRVGAADAGCIRFRAIRWPVSIEPSARPADVSRADQPRHVRRPR